MSLLRKESIDKIKKRIIELTNDKNGHLILKNPSQRIRIRVNGKLRPIHAWHHIITSNETFDHLNVRYERQCNVENCISHYIPFQLKMNSIFEMTHYDLVRYIDMFDKHSKTLEGSHMYNTNDPKRQIGDCIVWTAALYDNGYGACSYFGSSSAHMFSYMLWNMAEIPADKVVRHKCIGRHDCVNPEHLELGSHKDNADDRRRDGTLCVGEKQGNSKLTEDQVKLIREGKKKGESLGDRSKKFDVSKHAISRIDKGKGWTHLLNDEEKKLCEETKLIREEKKTQKRLITFEEAEEIRKIRKQTGDSYEKISKKFHISSSTIGKIIRNEIHLPPKSEEEELKEYFATTQKRIESHVDKIIKEDQKLHWIWNASCVGEYGSSTWKHDTMSAHQVSYLAFNGVKPEDINWECVRHLCGYTKCVNPEHLICGTDKQNGEDKVKAGTSARGEKNGRCKISEKLACNIKKSKGEGTVAERATRFKVKEHIVRGIDSGKTWKWLSVDVAK